MKRPSTIALAVLALLVSVTACTTAPTPSTLEVILNGANEVPANPSAAVGSADVTVTGNQLVIEGTWDGFDVVAPGAHVHGPALPGVNAGILFNLTYDNAARTFEGAFTMDADQLSFFEAGQLYINLHSTAYPGGEIRGQIEP